MIKEILIQKNGEISSFNVHLSDLHFKIVFTI